MFFLVLSLLWFRLVYSIDPIQTGRCVFYVFIREKGLRPTFTYIGQVSDLNTKYIEPLMFMYDIKNTPRPKKSLEVFAECIAWRGWNHIRMKTSVKKASMKMTQSKYDRKGLKLYLWMVFAYPTDLDSWHVEFDLESYWYINFTVVKQLGLNLHPEPYLPFVPQILYNAFGSPEEFGINYTCILEQRGDLIWPKNLSNRKDILIVATKGPITGLSKWRLVDFGYDSLDAWIRFYVNNKPKTFLSFEPFLDNSTYHHMSFIYRSLDI